MRFNLTEDQWRVVIEGIMTTTPVPLIANRSGLEQDVVWKIIETLYARYMQSMNSPKRKRHGKETPNQIISKEDTHEGEPLMAT